MADELMTFQLELLAIGLPVDQRTRVLAAYTRTLSVLHTSLRLRVVTCEAQAEAIAAVNEALGIPRGTLVAKGEDALSRIARLVALVRESRRAHHHCEDAWFCCGKCDAAGHDGVAGLFPNTRRGKSGHHHRVVGACDCGADAWNAKVDAALSAVKEP